MRKQLVASKNLRELLIVLPYQDRNCIKILDKTIAFLGKQVEQLESELPDIAASEFDKQLKALTSIKGIGITLATSLILATGGFTYFDNAKQLSRFIGICPTYQQSGTSVNIKGHINRNGDENLRSMLYISSWSVLCYNTVCFTSLFAFQHSSLFIAEKNKAIQRNKFQPSSSESIFPLRCRKFECL